jgi:excinuclease UvrABC nuclease subunit
VYLYFNAGGETIYVGKARALRDRVRNYLGAYGSDPKTDALLDEVSRLECIVTDSVVEALALENNLIKQRTPKYNILLRDDKNYPYLQLTTNEAFPRRPILRGARWRSRTVCSACGRAMRSSQASGAAHVSSTTSSGASRRASTRSARPRNMRVP